MISEPTWAAICRPTPSMMGRIEVEVHQDQLGSRSLMLQDQIMQNAERKDETSRADQDDFHIVFPFQEYVVIGDYIIPGDRWWTLVLNHGIAEKGGGRGRVALPSVSCRGSLVASVPQRPKPGPKDLLPFGVGIGQATYR